MATSSSALISPTTFSAAVTQRNLNSISFHGLGGNSSQSLPRLLREKIFLHRREVRAESFRGDQPEHGTFTLPRTISLLQFPERKRGETGTTGAEIVGFNIVDVLAWGSIRHIVAYYILATSTNGYDPNFFG